MQFEWDEDKRRANIEKHGIDFLRATMAFDGRPFLEFRSAQAEERRFVRIVVVDELWIAVIWTWRASDTIRIISLRRARDGERGEYRALFG